MNLNSRSFMAKQRSCLLYCAAGKGSGCQEEAAQEIAKCPAGHGKSLCHRAGRSWAQDNGPSGQSFENMYSFFSLFTSDWLSIAPLYCSLFVGLHSF